MITCPEYLGTLDVSTKLRNRAFLEDEMNRIELKGPSPVTVVAIDLNRLKATTDEVGHAAGDALWRRAREVLAEVADRPCSAAQVGGDEFVVPMPGMDETAGDQFVKRIRTLTDLENPFSPGTTLGVSMGRTTAARGEGLEAVLGRADERMYTAESRCHASTGHRRRGLPLGTGTGTGTSS